MFYRVASIDIHKKVLMVVVASAAQEVADATGEALEFECRRFGAGSGERKHVVAWLRGTKGEGSGDGIDGAVLEAGMAGPGAAFR
jgi:hypothetical protein